MLNEEVRQVLAAVTQVPLSTHNILCAIGKVDGPEVWHSFPQIDEPEDGHQLALYLYPTNIRRTVELLSNPETPALMRDQFHSLNPLPGADWRHTDANGWILHNPDIIWPEDYGHEELLNDVHAYQNLLTRVAGRLPKSFVANFSWSGKGGRSGTVSHDPVPCSLTASFNRAGLPPRTTRRRDACGKAVDVNIPGQFNVYSGDAVNGRGAVCSMWSPDRDITGMEMLTGAGTFVGEQVLQPPRLQYLGRRFAHLSPTTMMYRMVDAPRPKML